jgi:hypothetical protein
MKMQDIKILTPEHFFELISVNAGRNLYARLNPAEWGGATYHYGLFWRLVYPIFAGTAGLGSDYSGVVALFFKTIAQGDNVFLDSSASVYIVGAYQTDFHIFLFSAFKFNMMLL